MKTKLKKPLNETSHTCLMCATDDRVLPIKSKVIAGFGSATITKDGETVYYEKPNLEWEKAPTLLKFEKMARKDPDHDWRYNLDLPLRSAVYQRHGENKWCLIEKGLGFA